MAAMMKMPQPELPDYFSKISKHTAVRAGSPLPLGTQETGGVNFATFSWHANRVRLELFDEHGEDMPEIRNWKWSETL